MAVADVLNIVGDTQELKSGLMAAFQAITKAGQDYAKSALKSASSILEVAYAGGTCASVYGDYYEVQRCTKAANHAVVVAASLSNMLAAVSESDDDEANAFYADFLMGIAQTDQISALLEGASRRIEMANTAMPEIPQPAARYNAAVFEHNEG